VSWIDGLKDATPGVIGSALALFFYRRPLAILIGMFLGGCAMAYFVPQVFIDAYHVEKYAGLVGFLTGLFGMAAVAKVYDGLDQIDLGDLWQVLIDALRRRLGLPWRK
jgi:hypothetical protein